MTLVNVLLNDFNKSTCIQVLINDLNNSAYK